MAADKGEINAMNNYGFMFDNGEGVSMNKEEACRYYKMAADKGEINAMLKYGDMLPKGEGENKDKQLINIETIPRTYWHLLTNQKLSRILFIPRCFELLT